MASENFQSDLGVEKQEINNSQSQGECEYDEPSTTEATTEWMSNLPTELQTIPISQLAIPGSHNSGSYSCEVISGLSPDAPSFVKNIMKVPGFGSSALLSIVQGWAICQSLDIEEQLHAGIRYFDLRVTTKVKSDELFICHSLYATEVKEVLHPIVDFLENHPNEVVLLDFNHFHNMEAEHHMVLITLLISMFGAKICGKCSLDQLTLKQMWDASQQVLIFYHNGHGLDFDEVLPASFITSPWPNTDKTDVCISKLTFYHTQPKPTPFFVSQGILTPSMGCVLKNLLTANLYGLNKKFTPSLVSWIQDSSTTRTHQPNIVIADFVHEGNFIKHVLDLNKQRNIKL